jgi:hypothetical protein
MYKLKTNEAARIRHASLQIAGRSRQHRQLQNHHSSASGGDGQKPLRNPRDEIEVAHVCILRWLKLIEQVNRVRRPAMRNKPNFWPTVKKGLTDTSLDA